MNVLMSWARSTVTQLERSLGRSERYFDRILIGVLVLLAIAVLSSSPPADPIGRRADSLNETFSSGERTGQ